MSVTYGRWHGLAVELEDDTDPTSAMYDLMHPSGCAWSVDHHPRVVDTNGYVRCGSFFTQRHSCDIEHELIEMGAEAFPTVPGFYWVRVEHHVSPSGPWGGSEYDATPVWVIATPKPLDVASGEPA